MEWRRSRSQPRRAARLLALVALCAAALLAGGARAWPAPPGAAVPQLLDSTVGYLQRTQNMDGGFSGSEGGASDPDVSSWVTFALAADSVNPLDQAKPGGVDAFTYLVHNTTYTYTTDYERSLLVVLATGSTPHDFGGTDLVETILSRQLPDGGIPQTASGRQGWVNSTAWGVLALVAVHEPATDAAVQAAASWLTKHQNGNGSWASSTIDAPQDVDMTGAVLQALADTGHGDDPTVAGALSFLHGMQNADGGFPEATAGGISNVASTAWAVQGLWALGLDPRGDDWRKPGGDPLTYMASLQQPNGMICWMAGNCQLNPLWMTAQVAPAFAGRFYPIYPAVPRADPAAPPAPTATPPADSAPPGASPLPGQGGTAPAAGGGVSAGGGGNGAPLFSRPQPQSKGHTPGGARKTTPQRKRAAARRTPTPTAHQATPTPTPALQLASTPTPTPTATPTRTPAATAKRKRTANGTAIGAVGTGTGAGPNVTGVVIGGPRGYKLTATRTTGAAPGLRGAEAGSAHSATLALVIAALIALAAAAGAAIERRRPLPGLPDAG